MKDSSAKSLLGRPQSPSAVHMGAHLALGAGVDDPEAGALLLRPDGVLGCSAGRVLRPRGV